MFHPMGIARYRTTVIRLFACTAVLLGAQLLFAQEVRTFDGWGNNPNFPEWGAAETQFITPAGMDYADGVSEPTGMDRPNPRVISNGLFAQSERLNSALKLSDYVWVFGQFVDHDLTLSDNNLQEPIMIPVPQGDPVMDPFGTGQVVIPMFRNIYDPSTGTDPDNPRVHINAITSFIDASAVYGSDDARANWLRTFEGGKLKVSEGDLMPFNTTTGEFNDPVDPSAPFMADDVGEAPKLFVAGDVRANENPLLISFHNLFVREHNRLCDIYAAKHPDWDDERIYQKARSMVIGFLQSVIYDEWLPAMGVYLPEYEGYDPDVNPSIANNFAVAAFRLGHTLLSEELVRMDENGEIVPQGNLSLRDAFFNPLEVLMVGGLDPYFKGMGTQIQQELDCKVIDDVRNFLFGPPGAGGLDLASINIMRGRERGLPDFNAIRVKYGLEPYTDFSQICSDPSLGTDLSDLYDSVDDIDPWVGMLAEDHMPEALFGETIMAIMKDQFLRLRDGDRFYYMADPAVTPEEREEIRNTLLSDIIRRNTRISLMQDYVFFAKEHDELPFAGVEITRRNLDIALFPNPVIHDANFKMFVSEAGEGAMIITDVQGREVMSQPMEFRQGINTYSLDVSNLLVPGIYFVRVEKDNNFNVVKLIKH